jgi:branched-chain amino acid transport system substrate-binding protein
MVRALSVIADSFGGLFPREGSPGSEKPVVDPTASGAAQRWLLLGRFVCVVLLILLVPLPSGAREHPAASAAARASRLRHVHGLDRAGLVFRLEYAGWGSRRHLMRRPESGGIKGKRPTLVCLDDGYEPARTAPNMRHLIHDQNVLAIIGNVGTPTAVAAIPIANAGQTAFFGAFTGAGILRKTPPDRYVINYRASYAEEVSAMIEALIGVVGLRPFEIAFFTQRDTYGDAGFAGGIAALKKHGLLDENQIVHSRYERNTLAVENGLADIILADPPPKAVIMVGAYAPCAAFIRLARQSGLKALFLNVSFVGSAPLAKALGKDGDGVIITQVVPHFDAELPIVQQYRSALVAYADDQEKSFSSLEGYIAARILLKALETITGPISRDGIVTALEGLGEFSIGMGEHLHLGPQDHQACHRIWPTVLSNGKAVPYSWSQLAKNAAGGPNG